MQNQKLRSFFVSQKIVKRNNRQMKKLRPKASNFEHLSK